MRGGATETEAAAAAAGPAAAPRPVRPIGRVFWLGAGTLMRRELGRYVRFWPVSIAGPALSMVLYILIFALALGPMRGTERGDAVLSFIAPGLVLFAIMQRAGETGTFSLILDKLEGVIADLLVTPLNSAEFAAAYALAGAAAGIVTGLPVVAVLFLAIGIVPERPLLALAFAGLSALLMALFGVLAGLWARKWDHVAAIYGFVVMPLAFVSGLFAPVDRLPEPLAAAVRISPFYYAFDGFRGAVIGVHREPLLVDLAVVGAFVLAFWALAHRLIRHGYSLKD
jgi:ABC-2 type transport system permease protein